MQVRGAKRDGDARRRACARRAGCTTKCCSPPQPATLPEGVRHVMGRAEAHGGSLRVHRRRKGALRMRLWRMRRAFYRRWEHGSIKEYAYLRADGTCEYDYKACRADYAPFVALQAMVVPIKARPPLVPPQPPLCRPHFFAPAARQSVHSATFSHSQELATTHADKVRARRLRHQPEWAVWHSNCQTNAPRVQPGRRTGRRGALRMRHKPHA